MRVLVYAGYDVVLMSMLRSIYIVSVGLRVAIMPMSVGLVASFLPAASVGNAPTVFCRLGCPVRLCLVSIGVFCALYICLFLEVWVIIVNYKRSYFLFGKGKVTSYCSCSYVLGLV